MIRAGCRVMVLALCSLPATLAGQAPATALLATSRLAALPAVERARWTAYIARSDSARARDRAVLDGELRALGRTAMDSAPFRKDDFGDDRRFTAAWWKTAEAARLGTTLLSYQTASGGWSKHFDYNAGPRAPGQSYYGESARWNYIATLDNHATTGQVQYLLALQQAQPARQWESSLIRAAGYLRAAQMPNGCWPQVWPLQGSYHDAITFNDDAVAEAARTMELIAAAPGAWVPDTLRRVLQRGADEAVQCLLRTQVVLGGRRTIWGQQHDPLTLAPTQGRSYELPSLATAESAGILDFLIPRATRDTAIASAVRDAATWLEAHAIRGQAYEQERGVFPAATDARLWARLYTLDTQQPLFANRDGIPRTSLAQLTDRRTGYNWYGTWPEAVLSRAARAGVFR